MEPLHTEDADYKLWCAIPEWTAEEFVALSLGINSNSISIDVARSPGTHSSWP